LTPDHESPNIRAVGGRIPPDGEAQENSMAKGGESIGKHLGLLFLRLGAGGLMFGAHGLVKVMDYTAKAETFPDPFAIGSSSSLLLAIFAEALCALLVAVGLFTRLAAIPLLTTMIVAAFWVHADDPFVKKELALLYAIPFLTLIFTGPGRFSLDSSVLPKMLGGPPA
jgi:putative oxidoreductase